MKELARHIMVDFVQMEQFCADPLIFVEGENIYLTDVDGKRYIDGLSGVFVVNTGHRNTQVIAAMVEQLNRLAFAPPLQSTNVPALQLSELLLELTPPQYTTVKYASGGSEATEAAIKLARQFHAQSGNPRKYKIISCWGGYHGGTLGALSAGGLPARKQAFEPFLPGFVHVHPPDVRACPLGLEAGMCQVACARQFEQAMLAEGPDTVAAVIVEPVLMAAGVLVPPPGYLEELRAACDRHNVLLIFDEIITGFGRLGTMFGCERFGVWPDMICCGKGMSSGYAPLAATILSERVASAFWGEEGRQFVAGHTYAGNPLACAAGYANLRYMREAGVVEQGRAVGEYLGEQLETLRASSPAVSEIRGLGMLYGVFLDAPPASGVGRKVQRVAQENGLIIRGGPNFVVLAPPLITTPAQVDDLMSRLEVSIQQVLGAPVAA
jgi:adenosylmethionine-8-amino-7-oxononanoate aminotransferase